MRKQTHQLFQGLMFLQGHFARPDDLDDDFAPLGNRSASARWLSAGHPARGHDARSPEPAPDAACATC